MFMLAWSHPTNKPASYQIFEHADAIEPCRVGTAQSKAADAQIFEPVPVAKGLLYRFDARSMLMTFEVISLGSYDAHKEALLSLGFRLPGQL